jgi:hypothetical protein
MNKQNLEKKLLFICSDYYPPSSVSGAIMSHHIVKYLGKIGWEVAVLTSAHPESKGKLRQPQGYENKVFYSLPPPFPSHKTIENWGNKKFGAFLRPLFSYLVGYGTPIWHLQAKKIALSIIKNFNPQIIIASHPEPKCLLLAKRLSRKRSIPWVAFMYDPWSKAPRENKAPIDRCLQKLRERMERKTLQSANAIITVSEGWEFLVDKKKTPVYVIHRGFDPEVLSYEAKLLPEFTITFAGSLLGFKRDPSLLLFAISRLMKEDFLENYPINLRFYLHSEKDRKILSELVNNLAIGTAVDIFPPIDHKKALIKEKESACLLLLTPHSSVYTGKISEYLGCRRPILALMPKDYLPAQLIRKLGAGFVCENEEEVYNFLKKALVEFYEKGDIEWEPDWDGIESLSWENQARRISEVLEKYARRER